MSKIEKYNEVIKLARHIIEDGHLKHLHNPSISKVYHLLISAVRNEDEKINGKNIYCMHAITSCNWCEDNQQSFDYTYKQANENLRECQ